MKFTKTKIILLLLLFIDLIPAFCLAQTYKPMEGIPGIISPGQDVDFPTYLMAIYKFGLWAIGISAVFMIMIGGYIYLTSAGNTSQTGKAKGIITDAIAGVILALVSYVLLYTINPELVQFKPLNGISTSSSSGTATGTGDSNKTTGPSKYAGYNQACPDPTSIAPIDFSKSPAINLNPACTNLIPEDVGGVSRKILRTIAQMESSCGTDPKAKNPSAESCGIMQIKPATAGPGISCQDLVSNNDKSIQLAAQYIKNNKSKHNDDPAKIFAGYNSGYEEKTATGKSASLAKSKDCINPPTTLAFQCCKDPDDLDQAIHYAWKGMGIYKSQN